MGKKRTDLRRFAGAAIGVMVELTLLGLAAGPARAAETAYPFEGSWVQTTHPCIAGSVHLRTYTAREVVSSRGRCSIRRIAQGAGAFEVQEDCRHDGRADRVTETIRVPSSDVMVLRRQEVRLKIPRAVHYARCTAPVTPATAPAAVSPPAHLPGRTPLAEPRRTP